MKIQFEAGTSVHGDYGVNFLFSPDKDRTLYAECPVADGCSDDYGYMALKADIIAQAAEKGITEPLEFWYDGQEQYLEDDARADVKVDR